MKVFGYEVTVRKATQTLSSVFDRGWHVIQESFAGAWQRDVVINRDEVLAQSTVFACITLIASDIAKLRAKLIEKVGGIWDEIESPSFSPVLRKPNRYQTWLKFAEQWVVSKLTHGNTYVLKERDRRNVVVAMYVLDPQRVQPLVADSGDVYYQLQSDNLTQVPEDLPAVPASEIIHDRMVCLHHPLIGVSPLTACGLSATLALKIARNSAKFFENMSRPSGILTAPGQISDPTALRIKEHWQTNFGGDNIGKVAVLGDGLKYEAMSVNAIDAQLVDQLKLSGENVCAVFHVPAYMVGAGPVPPNNNVQALTLQYYSQCLQSLIESMEACLDDGLGLGIEGETKRMGVELCLDDLMRMDSATQMDLLVKGVGGIMTPDEARAKLNLKPIEGGNTVYLQQQNYSLAALAKRDSKEDPFGTAASSPAAPKPPMPPAEDEAKAIFDRARAEIAEEMREQKAAEERFAREFTDAVVRELDGIGT